LNFSDTPELHDERARRTFRNDSARLTFHGILEAGWQAFIILIAIEVFDAPSSLKALMASAHFMGLLATPITLSLVRNARVPVARIGAVWLLLASAGFAGAIFSTNSSVFAACIIFALLAVVQTVPLAAQIYSNNYRKSERGSRVATGLVLAAIAGMVFGQGGGWLLEHDMGYWPLIFVVLALSAALSAYFFNRIPSEPFQAGTIGNPFQNLSLIWKDSLFGYMLFCWMLIGFGNLLTMPLRVEYLANDRYGIDATPFQVALLSYVLPQFARILSMKLWGHLFDRVHFIPWRIAINACFCIGLFTYFHSTSLLWIGVGSFFVGLAFGGGNLAWTLWITRIAPPEKVSAYTSVHTGLTGLRGSLAPFVGYAVLEHFSPGAVGNLSALLIGLSIVLFATVRHHPRLR